MPSEKPSGKAGEKPSGKPSDAGRWVRRIGWVTGIVAGSAVAFAPTGLRAISEGRAALAAGVTLLMAIWWFTEALPISITALLPVLLFPAFGVFGEGFLGDLAEASLPFVDAYVFLFLGGMAIGAAAEYFNLHRRVALSIMRIVGTNPKRLLLGILIATASVSLWISNTATAVMMLPIAVALVRQLEKASQRALPAFGNAVMLGVAYASNVGGVGTKIGTGTNSIFLGFVANRLHTQIGFLKYIALALPFVLLFIPIVWGVLWLSARTDAVDSERARAVLADEVAALGAMSAQERRVAVVFLAAATLWIFGDPLRAVLTPHAQTLFVGFKFQAKHYEAAVSVLAAGLLLALRVLPFAALRRIPFAALLLIGGSFSMAAGIEKSGLGGFIASGLTGFEGLPFGVQVGLATVSTVLLTAIASNTATINVVLNVLPARLPVLFATCMAASCDFMLPAGTPPNAIVFGSGYVRLSSMMRIGFVLNVLAAIVITLYVLGYVQFLL